MKYSGNMNYIDTENAFSLAEKLVQSHFSNFTQHLINNSSSNTRKEELPNMSQPDASFNDTYNHTDIAIEPGNGTTAREIELYEIPTSLIVILTTFYAIIILTALLGNALVIYVVVVSPRMRTVTNFYIANLAFADVTIAMFAIPFQFHAAIMQRWDLPEFMCQFCPTLGILSVNISIFTLVAIAMDRYA